MANEQTIKNFTLQDIAKYHAGHLTPAEMHAMEKAALEDPFLADALEGYEATAGTIPSEIDALKKRLLERVADKQRIPVIKFGWWKIAAILLLFVGAGWLYTSINSKAKNESLAKSEQLKKDDQPAIKAATDSSMTAPIPPPDKDTRQELAVNKNRVQTERSNSIPDKEKRSLNIPAPAATPNTTTANKEAETAGQADKANESKDDVAALAEPKKEAAKTAATPAQKTQGIIAGDYKAEERLAGRPNNASNVFNGNVTDQLHKPVANAVIQIPNLNVVTQTDNRGYFSFKARDTALSVSIASDGFETQNINLRNKNDATLNQIILKPAPPDQRDVVVQSNGAERKKQSFSNTQDISIKILDAEPVVGWDEYNEYLQKNKKVDRDAAGIHGNVVVSFEVRTKGLNNFKIEQSLEETLDEEAIRLIKEGPAWKLLKGKKAKATVIVRF